MGTHLRAREFHGSYPPAASSVADVRRAVREWLNDVTPTTSDDDLCDNVELLVSEVVTNAVVHAGTEVNVFCEATADGSGVRVEVCDRSPRIPTVRSYGSRAGTGRGLRLLERLAAHWGAAPTEAGKCVWFTVGSGSEQLAARAAAGTPRPSTRRVEWVRLVNVPLLLFGAWVQHAEALLREYLLVSLDSESPEDAIDQHSQASDAIAVLEEHIPAFNMGDDPELALAAIEPTVTADLVQLPVPESTAAHFATLDATLSSALTMARDNRLLTPPTQPELVALRSWLCGEVDRQLRGVPATPWDPGTDEVGTTRTVMEAGDEVADVRGSEQAVLAADTHGTVVAASRPAANLLGYESPDDLEGTRLIGIIPTRYRQAHLAGFTLHQLNGRAPLLGVAVTVPALRRDGDEVEVRLTVSVRRRQRSEPIFVAALD